MEIASDRSTTPTQVDYYPQPPSPCFPLITPLHILAPIGHLSRYVSVFKNLYANFLLLFRSYKAVKAQAQGNDLITCDNVRRHDEQGENFDDEGGDGHNAVHHTTPSFHVKYL